MNVTVNGEHRQVDPGTTVGELVAQVSTAGRGVAVAVGGAVVPRTEWASRTLAEGDALELITAVQGG